MINYKQATIYKNNNRVNIIFQNVRSVHNEIKNFKDSNKDYSVYNTIINNLEVYYFTSPDDAVLFNYYEVIFKCFNPKTAEIMEQPVYLCVRKG